MRDPLSDMDLRRSRMPIKSIEEPLAKFQLRRGPGRKMMQGKGLGMRKMRGVKQLNDGVPELLS